MKRDFTRDFKEIQEMTNKIRSLNESISFQDPYCAEEDDMEFENGDDECVGGECNLSKVKPEPMADGRSEEEKALETEGGAAAVNQIRGIALKGMIQLCNEPENPVYQTLKKVFQLLDKAVAEKNEPEQQK